MIVEAKALPAQKEIDWAYIEKNFSEHLPYRPTLVYIDYRDSLEYCMKQVAQAVGKNDFLDLANDIDDSYLEHRWYNEDEYWKAFKKHVIDELDEMYENLDDHYGAEADRIEAIKEFVEDNDCKEGFREYLWEHDDSGDICKELMDNTDNPGMFYDLNEWFDETWPWSDAEYGAAIKRICRVLNLDIHDKKVRDVLYELLANASGGGNLRIYFNCPIWDLVSGDENGCKYGTDGKHDYKSIQFKGKFMVAIINMWEGSGMVEDDLELDLSIEFKRENLRISEQETYSYERVFGAYSNYHCDTPVFSFQAPKSKVEANGDLVYHQKREDEYNAVFKKGKCTCGDMNMSRHRHIKAFGWGDLRCEDCGTTWYCD